MRTMQGFTINGWTIGRTDDGVWVAMKGERTLRADSFADLMIKIDQAGEKE